jgi:hypothetical protein
MDERDGVVANGDIGPWASVSADRIEEIFLMVACNLHRLGRLGVFDSLVPVAIHLQFPPLADK